MYYIMCSIVAMSILTKLAHIVKINPIKIPAGSILNLYGILNDLRIAKRIWKKKKKII